MYNPFKRKIEKKSGSPQVYNITPDSFLALAFGGGGWITASQAMKIYRQTAAVATAVDMIADAVKQIEPVIERPDGSFTKDHPVLDLLKNPNGFDTYLEFMGTLCRDYLLKHDALILSAGNNKRPPIEMYPVSLQNVSIVQHSDDYPKNYLVSSGVLKGNYIRTTDRNRDIRFYDDNLKELYHIKGYSSRITKLDSDSPLQAAAMEAKQIIKGKYHNVKLLENGGRLSLLVTFTDEDYIDDDEHQERVQRLNEQFGGSSNAGKIGVISGADVQNIKELGKSNKDMDFAKLETSAGHAIYLRYQIPLSLVTTDASTFDKMKTGVVLLYDNAVIPNAAVLFSGLTRFLLPRYKMDPTKERITYNPESIEPLKQRMIEEVTKRQKTGVETTNELRSLIPSRSDVEFGDVIYQRNNMLPLGEKPPTNNNIEEENVESIDEANKD